MKLVVQIPCLNEERTLGAVLEAIPRSIDGIDSIEILVIDDGSTDKTLGVAKKHGVKHFIIHPANMGLARSFHDGTMKALEMDADIVVNTDGDNQYPGDKITELVRPIIKGVAEIVVADRQTSRIAHFSPAKKLLQRVGSWVVNKAAGTNLPDAASGFRAYSIASIPITINPKTRESRLFGSTSEHVRRSAMAIIRSYMMYKPYMLFATIGLILLLLGLVPFFRFLYLEALNDGGSHVQSLLVGVAFMIASFISFALAVISDIIKTNRILIEESIEQQKRVRFKINGKK